MMRVLLGLLCFVFVPFAGGAVHSEKLFGVNLKINGTNSTSETLQKFLKQNRDKWSASFDPDCYYQKLGNKLCGKDVDTAVLTEIEVLSQLVATETKSFFQFKVEKDGKSFRDFGAIAQGFVLQKMKEKVSGNWMGDFKGDIYVGTGANKLDKTQALYISDTLAEAIPYAVVDMQKGWMISSSNQTLGAQVRGQAENLTAKEKIKRITLFAHPDFQGGRLDAWSTAVIAGGVPLLTHLKTLKEFKGKWAYLYFDDQDRAICSSELECRFEDATKRSVTVNWKE